MADTEQVENKIHVLVAEDEQNIGDLLVEILDQEDRAITVVHDGLKAVEELKGQGYDVLITDLMMPGLNGMEILREAKRIYPHILAIIITGYASLETAIQAVKEGAYDYLRKPFRLDELKISVDNACEKIYLRRENQRLLSQLKNMYNREERPRGDEERAAEVPPIPPRLYGMDWIPPSFFQSQGITARDALTELERLRDLLQQNLIDQEEFSLLKKRLFAKL